MAEKCPFAAANSTLFAFQQKPPQTASHLQLATFILLLKCHTFCGKFYKLFEQKN